MKERLTEQQPTCHENVVKVVDINDRYSLGMNVEITYRGLDSDNLGLGSQSLLQLAGPYNMRFFKANNGVWKIDFMHWDMRVATPLDGFNTFNGHEFSVWDYNIGWHCSNGPAMIESDGKIRFSVDQREMSKGKFEQRYIMTHMRPFKRRHVTHWISKYNTYFEICTKTMEDELANLPEKAKKHIQT